MKRRMMAALVLLAPALALSGCGPMAPPMPLSQPTTEDPDALCGAAVRVFIRKGWRTTNTCDTEARTVETSIVTFRELHWDDGGSGVGSAGTFRVIVSRGRFEIGVSCSRIDDGKITSDAPCPMESVSFKQTLANEILTESRSVAGAKRVRDQAPAPAPTTSGCTKDTDCKGDRVCTNGACVDPR